MTGAATATMPPERKHSRTEASRARARPSRIPNGLRRAHQPAQRRPLDSPHRLLRRGFDGLRRPAARSSSTPPPSGIPRLRRRLRDARHRGAAPAPVVYERRAGRMGPVLDLVRGQHPGPRDPAHAAATPATGSSSSTAPTAPRPSTPSTPARSAAPRATSSAAAAARSSTSPTARTPPTSTRARATGCGPTPTTRPTAAARCSGRGPMRVAASSPRLDALPRALGRARAGWFPPEQSSPRGPGLPGRPLGRPGGLRPLGAAVHGAALRRGRRLRRRRDRPGAGGAVALVALAGFAAVCGAAGERRAG